MQVLLLILVAVVLVPSDLAVPPRPWLASLVVCGGCLLLVTLAAIQARVLQRDLSGRPAIRRIETIARSQRILQWSAVGLVIVGVIGLGFRSGVRDLLGDLPLLDELVTVLPALLAIVAGWWIYHPFEARAREATLLRRIDAGETIHPPPGRVASVGLQIRSQMLMILVPIALLATTGEIAGILVDRTQPSAGWLSASLPILAIVPAVLLAPWLVVRVAGARPLPAGEIRDALQAMCREARVGVRDLLLWPTNGLVINAGITGLWSRWRWVMLTDGLLESLRREQVMAVMAHELAHARRHHMVWMALSVVALVVAAGVVVDPVVLLLREWRLESGGSIEAIQRDLEWLDVVAMSAVLVVVLSGFGWVSRRFERQADAFAAVRLSQGEQMRVVARVDSVTAPGIDAMSSALLAVSDANGVSSRRFSWRHGSIESRCRHLAGLIDRPIDALPIDRTVKRINLSSIAVILASVLWWWIGSGDDPGGVLDPVVVVEARILR